MVLERWALYIGESLKLSPFMDLGGYLVLHANEKATNIVQLLASCNWRVFFFSSTSITGWFAQLSLALSIMAMFVYLLVLALIASSIPARCATINCLLQRVKRLLPSSSESVLTSKRIVIVLGVQLVFYTILIAMIEMFIVWNAISDVNSVASAGQIAAGTVNSTGRSWNGMS